MPAMGIIQPYRNQLEDYSPNDFIQQTAEQRFMGITDPFVYFSYSKYFFHTPDHIKQRTIGSTGNFIL